MTFKIYNQNYNLNDLLRRIGYKPIGTTQKGEINAVRPFGADYPRFHIYMNQDKKDNRDILVFNIHLDQKKPVYEGQRAHSGDYGSETVKQEVERIQDVLFR